MPNRPSFLFFLLPPPILYIVKAEDVSRDVSRAWRPFLPGLLAKFSSNASRRNLWHDSGQSFGLVVVIHFPLQYWLAGPGFHVRVSITASNLVVSTLPISLTILRALELCVLLEYFTFKIGQESPLSFFQVFTTPNIHDADRIYPQDVS